MALKPSDAVSLNLRIWWIFGCLPSRNRGLIYSILYNTYGMIMVALVYIFYTLALMMSIPRSTTLEEVTASLFISLTFLAIAPKFWNVFTKRKIIWQIVDKIDSEEMVTEDDEVIADIVRRSMKKGRFAKLFYFNMACVTLVSYFIVPLADLAARNLPFPAWYGVDHTITPYYELLYTYQCLGISINCFINAAVDTFPCDIMSILVGQLEILAYKLQQIGRVWQENNQANELIDHAKIAECVEHHNFIVQLILDVEDVFGTSLFVQFLLSGIIICVTGFQLSILSPINNTIEFAMLILYFLTLCAQIFLPCYFGNEIMLKSGLLTHAVFSSSWYETEIKVQKKLIIFMERTKRPSKIYAGKMLELSLETFSTIINSSYKYYAVLQQMQNTKMAQDMY